IGFKLSKLLQSKIKSKSAGRVQSVALKLICDLEDEIEKFVQEEYYTIHAEFDGFKADYIIPRDYMIKKDEADKILATSKNLFIVESIEVKESKRNPKPPFITSTLQQDAVNNLYMSSSRVMRVAQKLYEGVEINGELVGLITYMRTDSDRLSQEFVRPTNEFIEEKFGKNYLGHYRTKKSDSAQDAHEAIRPTDIRRTPESLEGFLDKDELKVYKRIYDRALASLMASAVYEQTKVTLNASGNLYDVDGAVLVFDGFQKVLYDKTKDKVLPKLVKDQELIASKVEAIQKFTQPPIRYNEASLIKELESLGIGRPSTYATTIETLKSRDYVEVIERRFKPTEQGRLTVRELQKFFTSIMDVEYTSRMESRLDQIAEGKVEGRKLLKAFYDSFIPQLEEANEKMEKVKPQISEKVCPLCGKQLVLRKSKYGMFYGCSGYPKCRHIEQIEPK